MMLPKDPDELLDQVRVAKLLGTTPKFLEQRRLRGGGIPYVKVGRLVRYKRADIVEWIDANRRCSTSQKAT